MGAIGQAMPSTRRGLDPKICTNPMKCEHILGVGVENKYAEDGVN